MRRWNLGGHDVLMFVSAAPPYLGDERGKYMRKDPADSTGGPGPGPDPGLGTKTRF